MYSIPNKKNSFFYDKIKVKESKMKIKNKKNHLLDGWQTKIINDYNIEMIDSVQNKTCV